MSSRRLTMFDVPLHYPLATIGSWRIVCIPVQSFDWYWTDTSAFPIPLTLLTWSRGTASRGTASVQYYASLVCLRNEYSISNACSWISKTQDSGRASILHLCKFFSNHYIKIFIWIFASTRSPVGKSGFCWTWWMRVTTSLLSPWKILLGLD